MWEGNWLKSANSTHIGAESLIGLGLHRETIAVQQIPFYVTFPTLQFIKTKIKG
jgi:hypothetical protein